MAKTVSIDSIKSDVARLYRIDLDSVELYSQSVKQAASKGISIEVTTDIPNTFSIPSLEDFGIDKVLNDKAISVRSIEQNLDDAIKLSQNCNSLRSEYASTAKLYLDTSLKSEEFFRLDAIHKEEVANHLYELPYIESSKEYGACDEALKAAILQQGVIQSMQTGGADVYSGVLSSAQIKANNDLGGTLAFLSSMQNKPAIQAAASQLSEYKSKFDFASWQYNLLAAAINIPQLAARKETADAKRSYFSKDIGFRTSRAEVSRVLAYKQLAENTAPMGPLNYSDRLDNIKELFDIAMTKLIQRVLVLSMGAIELYGINVSFPSPEVGSILDDITKYLLLVQDEVAKARRRQRVAIFTIWLSKSVPAGGKLSDLLLQPQGLLVEVARTDGPTENAMLRGIAFEYVGKGPRPASLVVVPPAGATLLLSSSGTPLPLVVGRVLPVAPNLDIRPQYAESLWNGIPYGAWTINSQIDLSSYGLDDIAMHLWLAY